MAGAIFDMGYELWRNLWVVGELGKCVENGGDERYIGVFFSGTNVVDLARKSVLNDGIDGSAMVVDVDPVAHIAAIAIDRDRLMGKGAADGERDEFLGVLTRPIVV